MTDPVLTADLLRAYREVVAAYDSGDGDRLSEALVNVWGIVGSAKIIVTLADERDEARAQVARLSRPMGDLDLDSVPPCPVCGGTLTEHDHREPDDLDGWWGSYDCAECGWELPDQQQRLTYWTGRWGRTLAQEVARLRAERDEARLQGAREERAAVVAWLRTDEPYRTWMDAIGGSELSCATNAIERGEHVKVPRG